MDMGHNPFLANVRFITNGEEPINQWESCVKAQRKWSHQLSTNEAILTKMAYFAKQRAVHFIWECNRLEGTLPKGVTRFEAEKVLLEILNCDSRTKRTQSISDDLKSNDKNTSGSALQQLVNHLHAYRLLCEKACTTSQIPTLSEELIKRTHKIMMQGLETEDGEKVNAGVYRNISVHAGRHVFPSHDCVPSNMAKIVADYESQASKTHDPYQLASWLFFQVVSLHPFEDGNGRLSRLLWCYSLMRDGLPFSPVLTSDHQRSQKHLVWCLERDRRPNVVKQPYLTTLTVVSVERVWNNFLYNLDNFELPGILSTFESNYSTL